METLLFFKLVHRELSVRIFSFTYFRLFPLVVFKYERSSEDEGIGFKICPATHLSEELPVSQNSWVYCR